MIKTLLIIEVGGPAAISCIKRIRKNFEQIKIVGLDMDENSPGLKMSDIGIVVPPSSHPDFIKKIERIIKKHQIDLILPCFENAFKELARIEGPFITDFNNAVLCKDKLRFNDYCLKIGLPVPTTIPMEDKKFPTKFPQYVKPRYGVGSRDNFKVKSAKEYLNIYKMIGSKNQFISQEFIEGEHWNVDVFADNTGFISSIERKDLKQKDGNCITVEVMTYQPLAKFAQKVQEKLKIKSPFNLEVFETSQGQFVINEINLRFGGGIIFGALAGRDFVSYLISKDLKYLGQIERGVYTRYYEELLIKKL